jgi:membrane-bound inhibitor of C-type lysozyme
VRLAIALIAMLVAAPVAATRGDAPFVVTYGCDGGRYLSVGYPAFRDAAKAPIRIAWRGRTVLLHPARAGSGARYTSKHADLEWWTKGRDGFMNRLSDHSALLRHCAEI